MLALFELSSAYRKSLPVERATSREKGQPLCMSQYYRLFSSYRMPGIKRDCLISTNPSTEHVIIVCANQVHQLQPHCLMYALF